MNYVDVQKDDNKIEKIEIFFADKIYYDNCYRKRRHEQIIKAKTEARKEKRREQRKEKRAQLKKNNASHSILKEITENDCDMIR